MAGTASRARTGGSTPTSSAPSAINFQAGQTRANKAVGRLNELGTFIARPFLLGGGDVDLIVDVFGYFE